MYAQIYINDPDMSARVSSRMRMTDGIDASIVEDIDSDMVNHNPHAQQFLHAREILIERSRPAFEAAMEELERRRAAGEQIPDDHPSLRLQRLIPREDELRLRMHMGRNDNPGTHNIPTASEVAAIIINQDAARHRDIVLHARGGGLKRIYEISEHYDPLQYPLLLPRGEPGWTRGIPYAGDPGSISGDDPTMSLREFYAYLLHDRTESNSLLLRGGRLTQQYWVDQWAKAEQERLRYIEKNQLEFRLETIQGLTDVMGHETIQQHEIAAGDEVRQGNRRGDSGNTWTIGEDTTDAEGRNIGRRLILPPKFTGGPRYMYQRFLDAMAVIREVGAPNVFITMTCNPNWPEIKENLKRGQTAADRPDIVARVFHQKLKALSKDLEEGVLGIQAARVHTIEYQKRRLPHAHILMILRPEGVPTTAEAVNRMTSAELLDKEKHPELYETVISCMMHGPCGSDHPNCPCMEKGKCSKKFPKPLVEETTMAEDKYPVYRRRRRASGTLKHKNKTWDNTTANQWVVPYNPFLSQKYNCHINVEVCATNKAVKYIYKYVYKGSDMTTITIDGEGIARNEILDYLLARYISPVEACMRLLRHPTQGSTHSVVKLTIHLPNQSMAVYREHATTPQLRNLIRRGDRTTLTAFFSLCATEPELTRGLLYKDVPKKFRWVNNHWEPYKKYVASIGRLVHVSPQDPERFYLRVLLCHRRSPISFEDIRTVNGVVYDTFQEAAVAVGYVENDSEWKECLTEAATYQMGYQLRQLFEIILVYSMPSSAIDLWEEFKDKLGDDYLRRFENEDAQNTVPREDGVRHRMAEYLTLKSISKILASNGKRLEDYHLPLLGSYEDVASEVERQVDPTSGVVDQEINAYPLSQLETTAQLRDQLNDNQRDIFDQVIQAVYQPVGGQKLFFVDGPGGTGKSFLLEQILAHVRLDRKIAIAVASSGIIAATLLTGGRTAHSTFRIPIRATEFSTCSISKQSQKAKLIREASLIIWDEAPMMHRASFEAVDKTLRDLMDNELEPFGGKVVVFSGDHRQILPVLKDATRAETLKACFKSSPLWSHLEQVRLCEHMRVKTAPDPASAAELAEFSDFLLQIGEGRYLTEIGDDDICLARDMCIIPERRPRAQTTDEEMKQEEEDEDEDLPNFNLLPPDAHADDEDLDEDDSRRKRNVNALIDAVYPGIKAENLFDEYFVNRAILAPTNASVRRINEMVAERLSGETKEYLSVDSLEGVADEHLFEEEFLNSLNFSGIPPHKIVLKVGAPIIMIRNLNSDAGLCNGTRLRVVSLRERSIEAIVMSGPCKGNRLFIPRIIFYSEDDDKESPFKVRRKQFPVIPAFAMTINKAHGQSIHHVGIYLETPVFAHGQLYVALSRVTSRKSIKIAVDPDAIDADGNVHTKNIVYREIFQ